MKKLYCIIIVSTFFTFFAFTQVDSLFSPFVSRITAKATSYSVKITWKDSKNQNGKYVIYRNSEEITSQNLSKSTKVGEVSPGVEFFEDYPPKAFTDYYYCVIFKDNNNFLHEVFVPYRNNLKTPVTVEEGYKKNSIYLNSAKINFIDTTVFVDSIVVSFICNKPDAKIYIYRNTSPILTQKDLLTSNHVGTVLGEKGVFSDYPIPGVNYFYAAIDSDLVEKDIYSLIKNENATATPAFIPIEIADRIGLPKINSSRSNPLPLLSISKNLKNGKKLSASLIDTMPQYKPVSKKTETVINSIINNIKIENPEILKPLILKENRNPQDDSKKKLLLKILKEDFETFNYSRSKEKLLALLKENLSKDLKASVHFYLGEIYYFLKQYDKAFIEFVFAEDYFYAETIPWKNDIYNKMR